MADVDRSASYERTISDLRNQTQNFQNPHARDLVDSVAIRALQVAWNIERGSQQGVASTSSRMQDDTSRNR